MGFIRPSRPSAFYYTPELAAWQKRSTVLRCGQRWCRIKKIQRRPPRYRATSLLTNDLNPCNCTDAIYANYWDPYGGDMLRLVVFAIVSAGILFLSWESLRNYRSHGFFRFFAFESILGLFLLNVIHWFLDPFSGLHILSWSLLFVSLFLVVHGFHLLRALGRPEGGIENTTTLVTVGAYRYIRHPLYSSLLLFGWGVFFKHPSLTGGTLVLAATAFLVATAWVEEQENLQRFGAEYEAYMKRTKMFIPFLF